MKDVRLAARRSPPNNWRRDTLGARGVKILARNLRCKAGELDLVCLEDGVLAIVEVRRRGAPSSAAPWPRSPGSNSAKSFARRAIFSAARAALARIGAAIRCACRAGRAVSAANHLDQGRFSRYLTTCSFGRLIAAAPLFPPPGPAGGLSVGSGSASPSGKIMPCPVSRA